MALDVGSTVGDFEVLELVGRGGMGRVFKVRNLITERIEAMKILLADACEKPEVAARFQREIRLLASLNHPNVAALRTALRVENQLVMIMELVEGASLEQMLADGKVDVPRGVEIISQVLDGLSYAHRKGVIHRDIKPSNILVTAEGSAKLTDFGIASKQGDPKVTATGMALGSLYYMSPEQVKTAPLDPRSDLYSVGVTLYETTTGRRPIEGDSFHSIMLGHLEQRPRPPVEVNPRLAPELSRIIEKSLEKAPEKRFQTADEFRAALLEPQSYREPSAGGSRTASLMVPAAASPPDAVWDSAQLERVRKELAAYIGPMAKVLVSRAAKRARSLPQLYEILAAEITSEKDRQKFLGSRRP